MAKPASQNASGSEDEASPSSGAESKSSRQSSSPDHADGEKEDEEDEDQQASSPKGDQGSQSESEVASDLDAQKSESPTNAPATRKVSLQPTPAGSSEALAPSQSQPFPLPSPNPPLMLDPSIDLSKNGDLPPLDSSPEPDFPSLSDMLARTRAPVPRAGSSSQKTKPASPRISALKQDRTRAQTLKSPKAATECPPSRAPQEPISEVHTKSVKSDQSQIVSPKGVQPQAPKSRSSIDTAMESPSSQPPSQKPASRPRPKPKPAKPPSRIAAGNVTQKSVSSTLSTSVTPVAATDKGKGKRKADARSDTDVSITDESNPPAKRARNKGSVSSSHRPQKHDTFWILDGNAILEIGGVLFKLHRSRLVDQSLFFADLFEANLSDNDVIVEEDVSGTIYHLHNTTPRDFTALLMLDKNPFEYCFGAPPFYTIAAILRASTALRFPKYREFAIQYLERQWPSALSSLTAERQPHAVDVIILGRQQDVPRVLKRAFYELLRSSGFGLNDGEGDEEGEGASDLAWTQATRRFDLSFSCPNQPKEPGGAADLNEPGSSSGPKNGDNTHRKSSEVPKCPSPEAKSAAWERCVIDSGLADEFMWDPLCGLQALMDIRWGKEEGWCKECVKMRKDAWAKTRASLWARMDMWMSLPRDV